MSAYIARRVGHAAVVVFVVTIIVFVLLHLLPGGPAVAVLGHRASPAQLATFNHINGLDQPLPAQYWTYLSHLAQGDLGYSYKRDESVSTLLSQTIPKTIVLVGISTLLAAAIAIPLGVLQAIKRNRLVDYVATALAFIFYAMPSFWLGLLLIEVFAVKLHWLPAEAPQGSVMSILTNPTGLILPVAALALVTIASFSRYMRSSMLEQLSLNYVRTARARGIPERRVVWHHALRNALVPIVTLLGLSVGWILGGALVVESVFNYPGVGLLFWNAAEGRDYPVLLGVTIVVAVATVLGSLLADLAYLLLDPRVRYES